jgi:hypothetical protein
MLLRFVSLSQAICFALVVGEKRRQAEKSAVKITLAISSIEFFLTAGWALFCIA